MRKNIVVLKNLQELKSYCQWRDHYGIDHPQLIYCLEEERYYFLEPAKVDNALRWQNLLLNAFPVPVKRKLK